MSWRRPVAALALLLALGCEAAPELGAGCTRASECSAPLVCAIGRCRAACRNSGDCPALARCLVEPSSGVSVCSLERVDACRVHGCALGFVCQEGECVNACDAIAACPDGLCVDAVCTPHRGDAGVLPDAGDPSDTGAPNDADDDATSSAQTIMVSIAAENDDGEITGPTLWLMGEADANVNYAGYWSPEGPTRAYLRFALPQAIPAGATILDAHVEVIATATAGLAGPADHLLVLATSSADAPAPAVANDWPGGPSGVQATTATVEWGPLSDWPLGLTSSPDLAPLVDELVRTHGGLAAGAHVALWIWAADFTHSGEAGWADSSRVDADPLLIVRFVP